MTLNVNSRNLSPLAVRMLIHFHVYPTPWTEWSPAAHNIVSRFMEEGIIEPSEWGACTTLRGKVFLDMICRTPFPVQAVNWVDPRFK